MYFFPIFTPLLWPRYPLKLFVGKTPLFRGGDFCPFLGSNLLLLLLLADLQGLPVMFPLTLFARRVFFLYFRTGLI